MTAKSRPCEICARPIETERASGLPETRLCAEHAQKIAKLLKKGKDRQAQQLATGFNAFVNILTHGAFQQQVVHIRPGFWVLACLFDTQDHREHTTLGMEYDKAGLGEAELRAITRTAIEASFADEATKQRLLREIEP